MSERDDQRPQGVQETASTWEPPPILRARPEGERFDLAEAALETMARYPRIMARLAE